MTYDKKHIQYCMRFAFNLNKNAFETVKVPLTEKVQ